MRTEEIYKQLAEAGTPEQMRAAIEEIAIHSPIVHAAMTWAHRDGRNELDTMTFIAYYGLRSLVDTQREYHKILCLTTKPMIVITDG